MQAIERLKEIQNAANAEDLQVAGNHYKGNKIEPLDYLQLLSQFYGYTIASAMKYVIRYQKKGQFESDLLKVAHYAKLHQVQHAKGQGITNEVAESVQQEFLFDLEHFGISEQLPAYQMAKYLFEFARTQNTVYLDLLFVEIEKELQRWEVENGV